MSAIFVLNGHLSKNPFRAHFKKICIYSVLGYYELRGYCDTRARSMLKDKIALFMGKVQAIDGIAACALVSRDGIIAGKAFDRDQNEPWFGVLMATIFASAQSAGSIIRMNSMESVTIRALPSSIVVMGAGQNFLIAAIANDNTSHEEVYPHLLAVAKEIGQVL
jgi:uncharacterized protein